MARSRPTSVTAIIVFSLAAITLAVLGYDQIHIAQRTVAYLMIAILTVFSVGALSADQVPGRASGTGASSAPCPSSRSCSPRPPTS